MSAKIHENKFIYSPGTLIGGLEYKFHWQSQLAADLKKEETDYGVIRVGHLGGATTHKMHFAIGYQMNSGYIQTKTISYKDGVSGKCGYWDDDDTWHAATEKENINWIGVYNLSMASTTFKLKDYEIDLTSYSYSDVLKIGVILKDYSTGCTGISFGGASWTKCTVSIVS